MRGLDLSSWEGFLTTLLALALFALIGVGIRLLLMMTFQQRRERMNRQINERLKVLMAAYKVLGGSFTGDLTVDPRHLRELKRTGGETATAAEASDRARRIRDAVEAALADVLLLGTEEQVRLADQAARDLVAGRPVRVDALVVSLRAFIRKALDLEPAPSGTGLLPQGPTRPGGGSGRGGGDRAGGRGGGGGGGGIGAGGGGGMAPVGRDEDPR